MSYIFRLRMTEIPNKTIKLDSHRPFICSEYHFCLLKYPISNTFFRLKKLSTDSTEFWYNDDLSYLF
jgi:hypothetical protein